MTGPEDIFAEYTSTRAFSITGRGTVYEVVNLAEFRKAAPPMLEKIVRIDGRLFRVKAVESWALDTIRAGAPIGFLVEDIAPPQNYHPHAEAP